MNIAVLYVLDPNTTTQGLVCYDESHNFFEDVVTDMTCYYNQLLGTAEQQHDVQSTLPSGVPTNLYVFDFEFEYLYKYSIDVWGDDYIADTMLAVANRDLFKENEVWYDEYGDEFLVVDDISDERVKSMCLRCETLMEEMCLSTMCCRDVRSDSDSFSE